MLVDQPDDVLMLIFEQLDSVQSLTKANLVCKRFAQLCKSDLVWRRLVNALFAFEIKGNKGKKLGTFLATTQVYTWGDNSSYQLGLPVQEPLPQPVPSSIPSLIGKGVKGLACGAAFTVYLLFNGTVWVSGGEDDEDSSTCLGLGSRHSRAREPTLVRSLLLRKIVNISAGSHHVAACDSEGNAFTWGVNSEGCLGIGSNVKCIEQPRKVSELHLDNGKVVRVASGVRHTIFVTENKKAYGSGFGLSGCLGTGKYESFNYPVVMQTTLEIDRAACGDNQTILLTTSGRVFGCGLIGVAYEQDTAFPGAAGKPLVPVRLSCGVEGKFVQIGAGKRWGAALTSGGDLFAWGYSNHYNKTGSLLIASKVKYVSCGLSSVAYITEFGRLETVGDLKKQSPFVRIIAPPSFSSMVSTPFSGKVNSQSKLLFGKVLTDDILLVNKPELDPLEMVQVLANVRGLDNQSHSEMQNTALSTKWCRGRVWSPVAKEHKGPKKQANNDKDTKTKSKATPQVLASNESPFAKSEGPGHYLKEALIPHNRLLYKGHKDADYLRSQQNSYMVPMQVFDTRKRLPVDSSVRAIAIGTGHIAVIVAKD